MKKVALGLIGIVVVGVSVYCANILRNQEPYWGSVEIAAHTNGRRPCPPSCADNQQHMRSTWYGWNGKLVRKVVF